MNELLLLKIILGIFIWFNYLIAYTLVREISITDPCPFKEWYIKYPAYISLFILAFCTWPLGVFKLSK